MRLFEILDNIKAEVLRLNKLIPPRWKDENGSDHWRNSRLEAYIDAHPEMDLEAARKYYADTLEFLKANPKNILPNPYVKKISRKQKAILEDILLRTGGDFKTWLADTHDDAGALSKRDLLDALDDWLREEQDITVRQDGLIEFMYLNHAKQRLIGKCDVVLFHFTSSANSRSIRSEGLLADREPVNGTVNRAVYLTTEQDGPPVRGYKRRAVNHFCGRPVMITVKTPLSALEPDTDDADIASGRNQFIVPYVPPEDIVSIVSVGW